jgi:hypothetical protein
MGHGQVGGNACNSDMAQICISPAHPPPLVVGLLLAADEADCRQETCSHAGEGIRRCKTPPTEACCWQLTKQTADKSVADNKGIQLSVGPSHSQPVL